VARVARWIVPTWFVALAVVRVASLTGAPLGVDGRVYREAAVAWLAGGNPWAAPVDGLYFAAPPPSLLPMVPFALIPEWIALPALGVLCLVGAIWALRRWEKPLWWLAFPPLVDGIVNLNPHVLLLPLLAMSGAWTGGWAAPLVKAYAAPVLLLAGRFRAFGLAGLATLVTAPLLPWGLFVEQLPRILELTRVQTLGHFTAWDAPALILPAALSLIWLGRARAAWWVVPVFWPSTQYYYGSLAIPALTPLAALVLCGQFPGVAAVAVIVSVVELEVGRRALGSTWRPVKWSLGRPAPAQLG